jgi:uncharacterized membrane protein YoaK (UPF0700 family)
MLEQLREAGRTLIPAKGAPFGPLPPMLVALTVLTGLVDAVSYLALGRVFVANMTGNVVILGFAIAGASGFSVAASLSALVFFAVGSAVGGALNARLAAHRGRLLLRSTALQVLLVGAAIIVAALTGADAQVTGTPRYVLIALLAVAMGIQNAVVRKLAIPDLTTTVLTLTTTGIFADAKFVGGPGSKVGRRGISIVAMFLGALGGALLVLNTTVWVALLPAIGIAAGVLATAWSAGRGEPAWTRRASH